jgi:hypothetical protein
MEHTGVSNGMNHVYGGVTLTCRLDCISGERTAKYWRNYCETGHIVYINTQHQIMNFRKIKSLFFKKV